MTRRLLGAVAMLGALVSCASSLAHAARSSPTGHSREARSPAGRCSAPPTGKPSTASWWARRSRPTAAGSSSTNHFRMSSSAPTSSAWARCKTGVLLRAEKTPTGMKGVFLSLDEGDIGGYAVTLDANGKILTRERLRPGGGLMRVAPSAADAAAAAAARGGGARSRRRRGTRCAGRGRAQAGGRGRGALPSGATLPNLTRAVRTQAERLE